MASMAQDSEPSLCPSCGWRSPAGAPICIRCNYPLTGTALAPSHWTGSPWTVASAALLAFAMLCVSAFLLAIQKRTSQVATTAAYQEGLKLAEKSEQAQGALGDHIQASSAAVGVTEERYGSRFAEWKVSLKGSRSEGELYGVANYINGKLEYSRRTLIPAGPKPAPD
jgi:hypothetical protein